VRIFSRSAPVARVCASFDAAAATTCARRVTATTSILGNNNFQL
jgi:hypothetical protein